MSMEEIKNSLLEQLQELNKDTPYARSMVDTYMQYCKNLEMYAKDIAENGLTYEDARGIVRTNPSIDARRKDTAQMLSILKLFDLQNPVIRSDSMDDYM